MIINEKLETSDLAIEDLSPEEMDAIWGDLFPGLSDDEIAEEMEG